MSALWVVAVSALLTALAAWAHARRTARQLAQLTEMYWQLKYDHAELKAKVAPRSPAVAEPTSTFVPLTRLRSASAEAMADPGEPRSTPD
jgi:hypothetical protein